MRSAEGFISAPGIIALCRDWRLAPRQGNLHFPCDSLRCLPFCVPHESEHLALQAIHFHGVLLTVSGGDTIAIYHCSIKIVSRGKGKSAVAAAAYRAGEKLTNEWDGLTHDYTRKGGVVHSEIMLPPHAPPSFSDRSILWNSVEQIEKSNNSQLAREIEIALPVELSREEQTRLVREYCSSQFVSKGMCADFNIHDTGNGNPHAHILLTIVYLQSKGIATLEDLDAALSSVDEEAKRLNTSVVAKQKRMRTLEKFIEHGSNYNRLKPIHDELKTLKNGWGKKREKFEQAHESDLIIWNAANRFLHANLPEGTKSFKVSEWQKEFDELKAQSTGEYEELKTKRSEVKELQQIRKCIDIVEQAEQRTQEQTHQTPRRKKEDISL